MKNFLPSTILSFLTAFSLLFLPNTNFGQAPDLGLAGNFVLFTPVGAVGSTGISNIYGNVGSDDGAITGFETLNGLIYNADAITEQCSADLLVAYGQLNSTVATMFPIPVLGNGQVLFEGIYSIPQAASLNEELIFDAQGNPNAIFIVKIQGAFSTSASSSVRLINGAVSWNVYWLVEGAVSFVAGTIMKGVVIANNGAISMGDGCRFEGRALSTTGAVNVYGTWAWAPGVLPLKVSLIDFKVTKASSDVELLWTSDNEFSLSRYELERSTNGRNYYKIGSVNATNTPLVKTYNWLDNAPAANVNYYRLKMMSMDNGFKYSSVVKIDMNANNSVSVYPNPVDGHIMLLHMNSQAKGEHLLKLYNISGEIVMSSRIVHSGKNEVRNIALNNNLPKGVYYLEVMHPGAKKDILNILVN